MSAGNINRELNPLLAGFGQVNLTGAAQDWPTIATAMGLTAAVQGGMMRVLVCVAANPAVVRMDGTPVAAATGHVIPAGFMQVWEGEWLRRSSWINQGAGVAVLSIQVLN